MTERPRWVTKIWMWLTDGQYDLLQKWHVRDDNWVWWIGDKVQVVGCWTLCLLFKHKAVSECSIPDHDYCVFCNKPMPGQYPRSAT